MKLRHPNPDDEDQLVVLARGLHAETWYAAFDFDEQKVRAFIRALPLDQNCLAIVAESGNGSIAGFFAACCVEHWFGRNTYACDLVTFVAPQWRGGPVFWRMIQVYEAWARLKGVREIHIGFSSGAATPRIHRLYERLGYHTPATVWRKSAY